MEFDPWAHGLTNAMTTFWTPLAAFVPRLLGALLVCAVGYALARLLNTVLSKLLARLGVDRLMAGSGLSRLSSRAGIQLPLSVLVGRVAFWFVLLVFLVSAVESLGLERVSHALDALALYLPKMLGAVLVLLGGFLLGQFVGSLVRGAAEGVGMDYAAGVGRIAHGLVVIISVSVAIGQLEIRAELLNYVIVIALASVGLACALAFGLGSRELVSQILAGIYVRELFEVGQRIRVGELEGVIEEIGTTKTILSTAQGDLVTVANRTLLEQPVNGR